MRSGSLGKEYVDGEAIVRQGEVGDCMFVILEGQVEVILHRDGKDVHLSLLREGDFFGEMSVFEGMPRNATVRAVGYARVLTVDKRSFLKRMYEDPSLAFRLLQTMSRRIRFLNERLARQETSRTASAA